MAERPAPGEVIFEFRRIGSSVKVSAVHTASDTEVSLVAPASAGEAVWRQAALAKLRLALTRRAGETG